MAGILKILVYLSAGEIIALLTAVPIPGPMLGLALMLIDFAANGGTDHDVSQFFDTISKHLAILFVPAGAGASAHSAPKSVTTAVAINISEDLGGAPTITALVVILTDLIGATFGWPLLKVLGISDPRAKGLAIGVASHVVGTARVFQIDQKAGAFSSLGMILNAITTTLLIWLGTLLIR